MVHRLRDQTEFHYSLVWVFCAMYLASVALRLSLYNTSVIQGKKSGPIFRGLPCPGAAAGICSLVFLYASNTVALYNALRLLPPYSAVVSLLMISSFRYTHLGRWLCTLRRNRRRLAIAVIAVICLCIWPVYTLFILINGYILSGPLYAALDHWYFKKKEGT
jgi:CDP-diacylglycerol--serine O-phosphatidyltransferase